MSRYIQINSVNDIDLSSIRPGDLQNRYIDMYGNRYAIKFDVKTRRLKIIQLIKGKSELNAIRNRKARMPAPGAGGPASRSNAEPEFEMDDDIDDSDAGEDEGSAPAASITPDKLNNSVVSSQVSDVFLKTRDRIKAVLNHLKRSNYFEKDSDPRIKNVSIDLTRQAENDCIRKMEQSISLITELKKFPRPISHYLNKLTDHQKMVLEGLRGDDLKMGKIRDWELQESFLGSIDISIKTLETFLSYIKPPKDNNLSQMRPPEKQSLHDATVSADYAISELKKVRQLVKAWKES